MSKHTVSRKHLEKMRRQLDSLRTAIRDAEADLHKREVGPKMRKLVGTYWKYRNSYSCPEGEKGRWWMYRRIDGVLDGGFITSDFQTDKHGEITFKPKNYAASWEGEVGSGWQGCTESEWKEALATAKRQLP